MSRGCRLLIVRFSLESGHGQGIPPCPPSARSGLSVAQGRQSGWRERGGDARSPFTPPRCSENAPDVGLPQFVLSGVKLPARSTILDLGSRTNILDTLSNHCGVESRRRRAPDPGNITTSPRNPMLPMHFTLRSLLAAGLHHPGSPVARSVCADLSPRPTPLFGSTVLDRAVRLTGTQWPSIRLLSPL